MNAGQVKPGWEVSRPGNTRRMLVDQVVPDVLSDRAEPSLTFYGYAIDGTPVEWSVRVAQRVIRHTTRQIGVIQ